MEGGGGRWEVLHSEASVYRLNPSIRHTTVYMKFNLYVLMPWGSPVHVLGCIGLEPGSRKMAVILGPKF